MPEPRSFRPVVEGHRGFRAAWPENTLPGFAAAIRAGADAIELDVGLTRDGVVVVCHDAALDPDLTRGVDGRWITAPGPLIRDSLACDLRAYDVGRARPGGATARGFPGQQAVDGARVPALAEVLALVADSAIRLDVELKTDPTDPSRTPDPAELADAVVAVADTAGRRSRLALRSFDWRGLEHAARRWPELPLVWLTERQTDRLPAWRGSRSGPAPGSLVGLAGATWAPDHRGLTRGQVVQARIWGLRVVPWTVNEAADMARLLKWGVDGFCTDDPGLGRVVVDAAMENPG